VALSGTVLALHRYPVKSMAGEPAEALELFPGGAVGDRAHALYWRGGRRLTARAAPRMLAWSAAYAAGDDVATVTAPDGRTFRWDEPGLREAITEDLGKEVDLVRDTRALMQDLADSVLVTFEATHRALEAELGGPVDRRRFRTNVHVELDDAPAFAELGWEGGAMAIGDATLDLLHPCARCAIVTRDPDTQEAAPQILRHLHRAHDSVYGINARPRERATIRVGDRVHVDVPAAVGAL
jgi:hypothetical protein